MCVPTIQDDLSVQMRNDCGRQINGLPKYPHPNPCEYATLDGKGTPQMWVN